MLAGPDLRTESQKDEEHKDDGEHKEHTVGELGELGGSESSPVRKPLTAAPVESKVTEPVLPPDTLAIAATAAKELPAVPADQRSPETNHNHVAPPVAPPGAPSGAELKPTTREAMDASHRHGFDQSRAVGHPSDISIKNEKVLLIFLKWGLHCLLQ